MIGNEPDRTTAQNYQRFGRLEARGHSALYEQLAAGVAGDAEMLTLLQALPESKRQPNLLLAAVRFLGAIDYEYRAWSSFVTSHWDQVREVILTRSTQTNEVRRCATLLPLLASLPQPLALIEVGASAGLCLLPDEYFYRYRRVSGTHGREFTVGDPGPVELPCELRGPVPVPTQVPTIGWRAGLDLNPIDLRDGEQIRWLEALVWPDQPHRLATLRAAVAVARQDPPRVVAGDLTRDLAGLADQAKQAQPDATLVVMHSAVLSYVPADLRAQFEVDVMALGAEWISNEASGVIGADAPALGAVSGFVLSHNGTPIARTDPHGAWLRWLEP
ncbi:MAG: hypothetical protein JWM76_4837 [Pseudonocardiales bacterium]|nr:hypothetical protein [Pseudonocardiales bacterium]